MGNEDQPREYPDQPGNPLWEFLHGDTGAVLRPVSEEEAQALIDMLDAEDDRSSIGRPSDEDVAFLLQREDGAGGKSSTVRKRPQGRVGDGERPKIVRRPEGRP